MRIRKNAGLRVKHEQEDFSPMEGVGNMADAMLVFALGILLALIISWNIDITEKGEINNAATKYEVQGIENSETQTVESDTPLEELGKVYRDPSTGKYYVVEE